GSHERYKSAERLTWEKEFDCNMQMRSWLLDAGLATEEQLVTIEQEARDFVKSEQRRAWSDYRKTIQIDLDEAIHMLEQFDQEDVQLSLQTLKSISEPSLKEIYSTVRLVLRELRFVDSPAKAQLLEWYQTRQEINTGRYNDSLTSVFDASTLDLSIAPEYGESPKIVDGREVLNACFEANFRQNDRLLAFGEDVGKIGDVNQGFAGLQDKFGEQRVFDTGIRESAIIGKGMGLAMRGLRPIAEIQYLDYLIYALPVLSDDLASLSYRTK